MLGRQEAFLELKAEVGELKAMREAMIAGEIERLAPKDLPDLDLSSLAIAGTAVVNGQDRCIIRLRAALIALGKTPEQCDAIAMGDELWKR